MNTTKRIGVAAALGLGVALLGCAGSEGRTTCLSAGRWGTVLRTRPVATGNDRDEAVSVALRLKDGTTVSCLGGPANTALAPGDVIDGRSLHSYRTTP
jgi:hypothetical protein